MLLPGWQISSKSCTETKSGLDCAKTFMDTLPPTQTVSKHIPVPESALTYLWALMPPFARECQKHPSSFDLCLFKEKDVQEQEENRNLIVSQRAEL